MSDFVSRLAARAVGEAPRVEPAATPAESAPATPATEQPVAAASPAAPEVRSEVPELRADERPDAPPRAAPPAVAPEAERVTPRSEQERAVVAPATPLRRETSTPVAPATPPPQHAGEVTSVVEATPVPAAPLVSRVLETRREHVRTIETATAEEPPVRVHIGRLEVRANLEQPTPKPRPEREKAEGVSLGDYLRGKRSA